MPKITTAAGPSYSGTSSTPGGGPPPSTPLATNFEREDGTFQPVLTITYPNGATNGYVWTSDANGKGTWQAAPGSSSGINLTWVSTQTSNYAASANQIVPVDTTSGNVIVTLPNAPAADTVMVVKMVTQGGTNVVTVACAGSDVFNKTGGGTTGTLSLPSQGMFIQYNGAGIWTVIADDLPLTQLKTVFPQLLTRATVLTASGSAVANTIVPVNTTSGAVTVTLPSAPAQGTVIAVKCVVFGTGNNVTIAASGSDVFNAAAGATTLTLKAANQGVYLAYDLTTKIWTDLADDLPMSYLQTLFLQAANNLSDIGSASTAFGNISPLTAKGDLIYENATPAPARLAIGTASGSAGDFLGVSGGLPAWQQVSGQYLCTPTQYAPSQTTLTISTTTFAAVSSSNVNTGSFTAPASGSVVVTATFAASIATGNDYFAFGLCAHGTTTPMVGYSVVVRPSDSNLHSYSLSFIVTGLTPGTSYDFDLMGASQSGINAFIVANGQTGTSPTLSSSGYGQPVTMTVQAV